MEIVERIKQIIDYKQISVRRFCLDIGVANGFLDKVKDVGSNKLVKILYAFPDISPVWLLMGEGEMLRKPELPTPCTEKIEVDLELYKELAQERKEHIKELQNRISQLEAEVINKEKELKKQEQTHTGV